MKLFIVLTLCFDALLFASVPNLEGTMVPNSEKFSWKWEEAPLATAVIFLSAVCPCSNNHISYLKKLKEQWPQIKFIGVHSNTDENFKMTSAYFKEIDLNFEIVQDDHARFADKLKAFKTPHAFLISKNGDIIYQGGVSSSATSDKSATFYLAEAISAHKDGKTVPLAMARVLGCEITRD